MNNNNISVKVFKDGVEFTHTDPDFKFGIADLNDLTNQVLKAYVTRHDKIVEFYKRISFISFAVAAYFVACILLGILAYVR